MTRGRALMMLAVGVIAVGFLLASSSLAVPKRTQAMAGVVKNAITEAPLAGVVVYDAKSGNSASTDAEGRFTLEADAYDCTVTAWHPDYTVPIRWRREIDGAQEMPDFCLYPESAVDRVTDKFDRADGAALGSTTDSHHFPWLAGDLRSNAPHRKDQGPEVPSAGMA